MSLKGQRLETPLTDVSFFCNQVLTRGGVASFVTAGSGASMDQAAAAVAYSSNSSGVTPVGLCVNDVVNYDLTRQRANFHRDEVQIGSKVTLAKQGWFVTNMFNGTPGVGDAAHLTSSGYMFAVPNTSYLTVNRVLNPKVGTFHSTPDEDGFIKVYVNL